MKRSFAIRIAALLLALPVFLLACGLLPAQYDGSYLAALPRKLARLDAPSDRPRIVIVGGSAAAFGVDSALMAEQLPGWDTVHFGLYAGLGLPMMLELAETELRPGDLVIVMPEQQTQSLSDYFNPELTWQAADDDPRWLTRLDSRHAGALAAAYPAYAMSKLRYALTGTHPAPDPIYCLASFDAAGDLRNNAIAANIMPGGWDINMPVTLSPDLLPDAALTALLAQFSQAAQAAGAYAVYALCPINAAALTPDSNADAWYNALDAALPFPILGDPHDSLLDAGWFYDTNFHLNAAGRVVYTRALIRAVKAFLGDSTPTAIALPDMPDTASVQGMSGDDRDAACFTWEVRSGQAVLTGVTDAGRDRETLTIPMTVDGLPVSALADGLFASCGKLRAVRLQWTLPNQCSVGQGLLDGAPSGLRLLVPASCGGTYKLNYFWSVYAGQIEETE